MTETLGVVAPGDVLSVRPGFGRLTRDSLVFALGAVAGKAIGFLMLPVLTRLLTPSEFGRFDVISALAGAGVSTLVLGMDVATTRLAFDERTQDRRALFGTWYAVAGIVVLPVAAILILASGPISQVLLGESAHAPAIALVGLILFGGVFHTLALTVLRVQGRAGAYALLEGAYLGANAALAIVLLLQWRADTVALMVALLASWGGTAAVAALALRHSIGARPQLPDARRLLQLGLPLAPAIAATCIADFVNRAYLYRTAGAVAAGEFSVALRFGSVAALMVAGFQLAWQPRAYALGRGDAALRHIALDGQRILAVVVTGVVGLALVSPEVVGLLTGGRFPAVLPAVGAMLVAALAMGLYVVACLPSAMDSAMRDLGIAAICGVAVTFLSNLVLAPALGSAGTALSVVVGQFTAVATVRLLANGRRVRVGFPWWRMTLLVAGASLITLAATSGPAAGSIGLRALLAILVLGGLALEGTIPGMLRGQAD